MSECSRVEFAAQFWQYSGKEDKHGAASMSVQSRISSPDSSPEQTTEPRSTLQRTNSMPRVISRTQMKKIRVPPPRLIAEALEKNEDSYIKTMVHQSDKSRIPLSDLSSIQGILLEYLERGQTDEITSSIERLGYTIENLQNWSDVLGQSNSAAAAERYWKSEEELPFFLLLIILRSSNIPVGDLRSLMVHTWYRLIGFAQKDIVEMMIHNQADNLHDPEWHLHPWKVSSAANNLRQAFGQIEENAFMVLIARYLSHARRTFPQSIPSITYLFGCFLWFRKGTLEEHEHGSTSSVDSRTHHRLCMLYDQMIKKLSLPAKMNPAKNMKYAWQGQRTLLDLAGRYDPPLIIHQESYRSVIRALSGLRKSPAEQKLAANMAASWPPWREEQDGVDAERPIEDDLSRAILASRRMTEAGYHLDYLDLNMQIIAGREEDGTPTIASRHVSTRRDGKYYGGQTLWLARVKATRSIREAWMAFLEFDERKGKMTLDMYHAIFEKLVYERLRVVQSRISSALPGESKEVMEPTAQNFSADELARTQPLEKEMLYNHMISTGVAPEGQCLEFLVWSAPTIDYGVKYLQDSRLPKDALAVMLDCTSFEGADRHLLNKIRPSTINAFVQLLSRFAHRHFHAGKNGIPHELQLQGIAKFKTPLHYAIQLVRLHKPLYSPTWYSLLRGLASRHAVIAFDYRDSRDDVLSWLISKQILAEYLLLNLELNTFGLLYLCICYQKAIRASHNILVPDLPPDVPETWKEDGLTLLQREWGRLTQAAVERFSLPALSHTIHFATMHAYVRVLGITKDWAEMTRVLEWMIMHKSKMDEAVRDFHNAGAQRRRVFIAMKSFIQEAWADERLGDTEESDLQAADGMGMGEAEKRERIIEWRELEGELAEVEERLRGLLEGEGLEEWGGWPDDETTRGYREGGRLSRHDREELGIQGSNG